MRRCLPLLLTPLLGALEVSEAQFLAHDHDRDGRVTLGELRHAQLFRRLDRDGDGAIIRAEVGLAEPAAPPLTLAPAVLPANQAPLLGALVPDLELLDLDGQRLRLRGLQPAPLVAIALRDPDCPLGARFAPALARLAQELAAQGIPTVYLHLGADEAAARADRAAHGFVGHYVHQDAAAAAAALQAETTTEVYLLDAARTLRYRGALSDQYGLGHALEAPRYRFVADAVSALLAGREPAVVATAAPGCRLDLRPTASDGAITWHEHVSRIVDRHCVDCHHAGGPAPFALETYAQASGRRKGMIAATVEEGLMPPWFADPAHGRWANDRRLPEADRQALLAWIEQGCPEGDPAAGIPPRAQRNEWQIGEPDLVLALPQAVAVPAEGVLPYVHQTVRNPLTEDRWIEAYEILPGAPEVVHHVLVFLDDGERSRGGGLHGFFAGMVPGQRGVSWPVGFAKRLPAGAELRFQLHYTTSGSAVSDRTRIAFRFAAQPPQHEIVTRSAATARFAIPPHAQRHAVSAEYRFHRETVLLAFMPHMHLRGSAYRYELIAPDGASTILLDIPRYDFDWQLRYQLAEPLKIAPGSVLRGTGWYDNSAGNPANPDPTATVRHGEQSWDEMQIGYWEGYER